MVNRRDFLRFGALAACGTVPGRKLARAAPVAHEYFGLHPFIEQNPKAVFIRRTHVAHKMDGPAKLREGLNLSRQIFVGMDQPGIPLTHRIVLKPNATGVYDRSALGRRCVRRGHRPVLLRRHGHGAEGTGAQTVSLRGVDGLRHLGDSRLQRCQPTAGRRHRRASAASQAPARRLRRQLGQGAGRRDVQAHSALRAGGRAGHLDSGHRQVEGARHVPHAVGQEHAGPGGAPVHTILRRLAEHPDGTRR